MARSRASPAIHGWTVNVHQCEPASSHAWLDRARLQPRMAGWHKCISVSPPLAVHGWTMHISPSQMQVNWAACARTAHGFCEKVTYQKLFKPAPKRGAAHGDANDGGGPSSANGDPQVEERRPQWLYNVAGRHEGEGEEDEGESEGEIDNVFTSSQVAQTVDFVREHLRMSRTKGRDPCYVARWRKSGGAFGCHCRDALDLCKMVRCRPSPTLPPARMHQCELASSHAWLDRARLQLCMAGRRTCISVSPPPAVHGWIARVSSHAWLDGAHAAV